MIRRSDIREGEYALQEGKAPENGNLPPERRRRDVPDQPGPQIHYSGEEQEFRRAILYPVLLVGLLTIYLLMSVELTGDIWLGLGLFTGSMFVILRLLWGRS